jgi:hypothetical protein
MVRVPQLVATATAVLCVSSAAVAQGAPFTVSNPGTGDEVEFKIDGDFRSRSDRDLASAKTELTVPVGNRMEFSIQAQHRHIRFRNGRTEGGPGDIALAAKFYLLKAEESALGIEVGSEPEVTLPTGNAALGLGAGKAELTVPIMIVKAVGPLKIGTELAYTRRLGGSEDQGNAALLAMYRADAFWRFGVEVAARAPRLAMDERSTDLNVGFKFDASARFQLYGLFGEGIERPNGLAEHRARVGVRLAFGGQARRMKRMGISQL